MLQEFWSHMAEHSRHWDRGNQAVEKATGGIKKGWEKKNGGSRKKGASNHARPKTAKDDRKQFLRDTGADRFEGKKELGDTRWQETGVG